MLGSVRFERSISCSTKAKCIQSKKVIVWNIIFSI